MDETRKQDFLTDFSKHVPLVLTQQLIATQAYQYVNTQSPGSLKPNDHGKFALESCSSRERNKKLMTTTLPVPSIERFYGAVLFVDISGFTLLSQRLDVESLKNHINAYFSKILEIVERWGGDVVKFAGDAVYVVWPTKVEKGRQAGHHDAKHHHRNHVNHLGSSSSQDSKRSHLQFVSNTMRSSSFLSVAQNQNQVKASATEATDRAIRCGVEIIEQCGELPVFLDTTKVTIKKSNKSHGRLSSFVANIANKILSRSAPIGPDVPNSDYIAYLNIHAGVGIGLLAGVDIGVEDRWEYFLIGDPLSEVAVAESLADKGDIVVTAAAHTLFHPKSVVKAEFAETKDSCDSPGATIRNGVRLSCGCVKLTEECVLVKRVKATADSQPSEKSPTSPTAIRDKGRGKSMVASRSTPNLQPQMVESSVRYEAICNEIRNAMTFVTPIMKEEYNRGISVHCKRSVVDPDLAEDSLSRKEDVAFNVKMLEKRLPSFLQGKVRPHFLACIERGLVHQLIGHVHDVVRPDDYVLFPRYNAREENFEKMLRRFLSSEKMRSRQPTVDKYAFAKILQAVGDNVATSNSSIEIGSESRDELDVPLALEPLKKGVSQLLQLSTKTQLVQHNIEAELRTVTVMFIKIDSFDMSLLIDTSLVKEGRKTTRYDPAFGFLDRTENEQTADQLILLRLQRCMEVLHRAIYDHGGQLRQFIVDDKGTVCIASFGLRGSVNEDNAANALEAANTVIRELQEQGLGSSIGVTTGKVYCGLVGSMMRHEFALMGPSVNLSARLMGKATLGSILCDHETMQRDRAHDFKHVGDIKAKGYEDLVPTYRPTFGHAFDEQVKLIVDRRPAGEHHTAVPDSAAPYAKRYSSLRFSVAMDPHQFRSFTTFLRTKSVPGLEKLKMMIDSDFFVTDEAHAALFESMATRPRASISSDVSSMYKGCRPLRGRKTEIDRLLRFLFSERHSEDSLASTEGPSRLAVVVASGGVGKTALLSAVGRKLFSTAKQDGKCNVTVLRNRSNTLGGNMRMNPWKPILLELLRLVHKTMTALNRSASRLDPNGFESSVSSARISRRRHNSSIHMMLKEDSIQDYVSVADFIFSRLPSDLRSFRPLVLNMLGYVSDQAMPAPTESTASGRPLDTRVRDTTQILEAIFNFSVGYTKKVIVVIIEDAQSMDAASREVLQLLWQRCCGVHFVLSLLAEADLDHAKGVTRLNTSRWDMTSASVESKGDASSLDGGGEESPGRQCRALYSFLSYFVQEQSEVTAGRFLAIELATLNKTATAELIHDILDSPSQEAMGGAAVEDRVRELVSASGGHPLYTVQLATNLLLELQNVASDSAKEPPTGSAPSPTAITAASPTAMHMEVLHMSTMQRRVEEIICFRLDRLDAAAQIILKAATVCASHGRGFSADLVAFMLRHCPRLNATVMATLLSNYDEEDATDTQTSLEDFRSASQRLDPLVMQVVIVLKALSRRGAFVRARASDVTDSCDPSDEAYDAYVLAEGELLASEGGPTASMAEELFEFCIPTEQSTIYSLVIDELREYFHGKIAQYFYCKIAEKRLDDVVFAPSSFEAALTASSKRRAVSSAVANATPAVLEEEGQATAAAEVDLTEKIRAWLVLEIEIAYHAEQANLWPVAMRANMCVAMLERRTKNHRGMISALLEAFKVFKCYEQESETLLTPIPYAKLSTETDLGRTVHRFLLMSATHAGSFPPEYYADLEVLREHFSDDLENVCQVFGLDVLMISHAVKLHLFLADYYLVGFGELSHVPDILGIVVKLLLAVAVLKFMEQQAPPGQADSSPAAMLSQMDAGNLMRLETAALPAVIDSLDLSHFYNTTYALGSVNLQAFSVLSLDFLRNDLAPLFARAGEGGVALHCGMMLVQHLSRHDLRSAQAHWLAEHGTAAVPAETLPSLFQLGLDQRVTALGLFLYQLVCIEPSDLSDPQTAQLVEHVLGRLSDFMRVYEHTIFMFADVVPVFMALARLQRWSLINEIATVFLRESEVEAHEVMAAQVAFLRHFQSWSEGLMRVLRLSPVEPAAGDVETLVQRLLAATRFFAGDRINEGVRLLCDTFVSAPPPPLSAAAASAPRHTEVVAACLVTINEESQLFTLDQIVLQLIAFAFVLLAEPPADAADSVDQPDGAAAQTTFASSGRPLSSERQATLTNVLTHQLHVLGRERHSLNATPRSAASRAVYRNKLTQCHALLSVVADQHPALRDLLQASPEFVGLVQL